MLSHRGIVVSVVDEYLRGHELVSRFWDAPESHLGATVVRLAG